MPVTEQTPVNSYTGNGVTTVFAYTFKILNQADIEVLLDGVAQTLTTHYTVSGVGVDGGGNVTFVAAPANATAVVLHRVMAYKREIDYQENGDLLAATLDEDLDRVVMLEQQTTEKIDRSVKLAVGTTGVDVELPEPEAGKALGWNATATALANMTALPTSTVTVSSFMETVLVASDAADARASLGSTDTGDALFTAASKSAAAAALLIGHKAGAMDNLGLSVTMAANAATIALKGADGNDPSTDNPVFLTFRSATAGTGTPTKIAITAATSLTIPSGAKLGTVANIPSRIWVVAINNAGTVELAAVNCVSLSSSSLAVTKLNYMLIHTTAIDTASDNSGVFYANNLRSGVPYVVLGAFDSTQVTAGSWASSASNVHVDPPFRPGDITFDGFAVEENMQTGTTTIPDDDTIPQGSEGDQLITDSIYVPFDLDAANGSRYCIHEIDCTAFYSNSASVVETLAVFVNNGVGCVAAVQGKAQAAATQNTLCLSAARIPGSTLENTYSARIGGASAGTTTLNGVSGAGKMGGMARSVLRVRRISM
jgi:hypothetical protein